MKELHLFDKICIYEQSRSKVVARGPKARCKMPRREGAGRPRMADPRANKVSMRLSGEELKRFEAYAVSHGLSKADTLRRAVEELLKTDK